MWWGWVESGGVKLTKSHAGWDGVGSGGMARGRVKLTESNAKMQLAYSFSPSHNIGNKSEPHLTNIKTVFFQTVVWNELIPCN